MLGDDHEWDEHKRASNLEKHGFDFVDANQVHKSPDKLTLGSARQGETKWIDLAPVKGRLLMLVYVMRGDVVRCISMSVANRKESRWYDEFKIDDTLH